MRAKQIKVGKLFGVRLNNRSPIGKAIVEMIQAIFSPKSQTFSAFLFHAEFLITKIHPTGTKPNWQIYCRKETIAKSNSPNFRPTLVFGVRYLTLLRRCSPLCLKNSRSSSLSPLLDTTESSMLAVMLF